jgi:hypothetical protein
VSLANTQNNSTYGPVIDLLSLVSDTSSTTATTATFSSWIGANEQPVEIFFFLWKSIKMKTML